MGQQNPLPFLVFSVLFIPGLWYAYSVFSGTGQAEYLWIAIVAFLVAIILATSVKVADQWERAVVLRLGKFTGLRGPGVFRIIPIFDRIAYWIDGRIITTSFRAEKTLTKDTVPVDVEAVLFWRVVDAEKAALEVEDYRSAISWASQTALREVIGKSFLADMLEGREKLDTELQRIIDLRTKQWGVNVISVEIRDVLIPPELQDAMSMQAQAERERQARVILGDSERQVAEKFAEAALSYENNPTALHLRAMNMLYEGLKQNATLVIVPATVLDTMTLGDTSGVIALSQLAGAQARREQARESRPISQPPATATEGEGTGKRPPSPAELGSL